MGFSRTGLSRRRSLDEGRPFKHVHRCRGLLHRLRGRLESCDDGLDHLPKPDALHRPLRRLLQSRCAGLVRGTSRDFLQLLLKSLLLRELGLTVLALLLPAGLRRGNGHHRLFLRGCCGCLLPLLSFLALLVGFLLLLRLLRRWGWRLDLRLLPRNGDHFSIVISSEIGLHGVPVRHEECCRRRTPLPEVTGLMLKWLRKEAVVISGSCLQNPGSRLVTSSCFQSTGHVRT